MAANEFAAVRWGMTSHISTLNTPHVPSLRLARPQRTAPSSLASEREEDAEHAISRSLGAGDRID
jgi:hypothetical protein